MVLMKHRARSRTIWNDANPRPEGGDGEDMTAGQRAAIKEVQRLREKAERLRGTKSIITRMNAATAVKSWADALRAQLQRKQRKARAERAKRLAAGPGADVPVRRVPCGAVAAHRWTGGSGVPYRPPYVVYMGPR